MRSDTKSAFAWAGICVVPVAVMFVGLWLEMGFHSLPVRAAGGLLFLVGFLAATGLMLRQPADVRDKITDIASWVAIMIGLVLPILSHSSSTKLIGALCFLAGFTVMVLQQLHLLPYQASHKTK